MSSTLVAQNQLATRKIQAANLKLDTLLNTLIQLGISEVTIGQLRNGVPGLSLVVADYDNDYDLLVAERTQEQIKVVYTEKTSYANNISKSKVRLVYDKLVAFSAEYRNHRFDKEALCAAGLKGCLYTIQTTGGMEFWQDLMGYDRRGFRQRFGRPRAYTAKVIVEILDSLKYIHEGRWPSVRQFKESKNFHVDSLGREVNSLDSLRQLIYSLERKHKNQGFFAFMYGVENYSYINRYQ